MNIGSVYSFTLLYSDCLVITKAGSIRASGVRTYVSSVIGAITDKSVQDSAEMDYLPVLTNQQICDYTSFQLSSV